MLTNKDFNYGHRTYRLARAQAIARSNGKCQYCGTADATQAHHWAYPNYPPEVDTTPEDLTALCESCHEHATAFRRMQNIRHGQMEV